MERGLASPCGISTRNTRSYSSASLVRAICKYGKPAAVRTDNEAVFTSRLFHRGLWLLGVVHERIEKLARWQNGRIERFFGTFKESWTRFRERSVGIENIQAQLDVFRAWHNNVRPHQHLGSRVPADVWNGTRHYPGRPHDYFCEWEEVLTGFHFR